MNYQHIFIALFALCFTTRAAPPPELTILRTQYEKLLAERVTAPFDVAKDDLDAKFTAALDKAAADAQKAGNLPAVLAIEADKKRIADKLPLPDDDDERTPESLKKLRIIYREQFKKLDDQRAASHSALLPGYTAKLQALEVTLTKAARVDEAKEVMTYREGLKAGAAPAVASSSPAPAADAPGRPAPQGAASRVSKTQKAANARRLVEWALANGHDARVKLDRKNEEVRLLAGTVPPKGDFDLLAIERPNGGGAVAGPPPWDACAGQDTLRKLYLADWKQAVPASALTGLTGLVSLRELQIASDFEGSLADALPDLPALNILVLKPRPPLTGPDVAALPRKYPDLETFALVRAVLSDEEFAALSQWQKLSYLMFDGPASMLSPAKVRTLATLPKLRELRFYGARPDALDAGAMATLTNVRHIDFAYNVTAENIKAALAVPGLDLLELSGIKTLGDAEVEIVGTHRALTTLLINRSEKITDAGFAHVLKMENLTELQCTGCPGISAAAFESVGALKKLRKLVVHETSFDDAALKSLTKNRALKELGIRKTGVTDEAVKAFTRARPDVKVDK